MREEILQKITFGMKTKEKGLQKAIKETSKNVYRPDRESIRKLKKEFGEDYKINLKVQQASGLLKIADWTLLLKTFENKENRKEIIDAASSLVKDALDILEELKSL
jgi:hypothetical protein